MMTDDTKTSEFIAIGDDDIYTIFRLHSSIYVWDPGGHHIDFRLSVEIYRWKGPVEIVHITAKVHPYVLREVSVAPEEPSDSENL
jgi:hypothetical protein